MLELYLKFFQAVVSAWVSSFVDFCVRKIIQVICHNWAQIVI